MITIEQLLESVDLNFEPRWVTKDKNGMIKIFEHKPEKAGYYWLSKHHFYGQAYISFIKLLEFENKPWQECIYEVPRKTTGKIKKLKTITDPADIDLSIGAVNNIWEDTPLIHKINELVDAVNELKGAKND